jgi:hypothetical protein
MATAIKPLDRAAELKTNLSWIDGALSVAEPNAVASLVRERRLTLAELAEVPTNTGRSTRKEIADKRAARRAAASAPKAAAGRGNKRSS